MILSSLTIVSVGYLGKFIMQTMYDLQDDEQIKMVMIAIIIITAITNFLCIVLTRKEPNRVLYVLYGATLITLFLFFSFTQFDSAFVNILTDFYEIKFLELKYLPPILMIGLASSLLLFFLQKMRKYILFGIKK